MTNPINNRQSTNFNTRYLVLLLSFFLIAYIFPLGIRDLVVPDETRYAEIPREMIASGNWVSPHFNGVRYFEKPVFGYWVHAGAILLLGENNFAVRLPSALSVGLSALLIYLLVYRADRQPNQKNRWRSALAALVFFSCFGVFGVGNTAVLDNLFSLFLTAAIVAFFFATEALPGSRQEKLYLILAGVSCGLAFLTKGFLAFVVPVLALSPYLIWQRRYFDLLRMSWLPILVAVVVVLPWSILIHLQEPDFWYFFFWNEHIRRFMADNAQHKESFWYFFLTVPGMFIPWTFMSPAALSGIRRRLSEDGPQSRLIRLALCWLVLPFLFFSFSNGKLLTYILPCIPPFAILMACGLLYCFENEGRKRLFHWGAMVNASIFFITLNVFVIIQVVGYHGFYPYSQPWRAMIAASGLIFFVLLNILAFKSQRGKDKVLLFGLAPLLLFFTASFIVPDLTLEVTVPGPFLKRYQQNVGAHDIVISDKSTIGAVCWYLKRRNVYVLGSAGELEYGLSQKGSAGRWLDIRSGIDLIRRNPGKVVLITKVRKISKWRNQLPKPVFQDDSGPEGYVFWRY
jgi:4-amino-4-deoxy-L-arabinose transferase